MNNEFEWVYLKSRGFTRRSLPIWDDPEGSTVIVRPKWVGICGSDLYLMETFEGELTLGHEWVGIVESVGPEVASLKPGDCVTSTGTIGCFSCFYCEDERTQLCQKPKYLSSNQMGALRSWLPISENNLVKIVGELSAYQALYEVLAVAEEAIEHVERHAPKYWAKKLIILGGGPVGLLCATVARKRGIDSVIIEKEPSRVKMIRALGYKVISLSQSLIDSEFRCAFSVAVDATSTYNQGIGGFKYCPIFLKNEFFLLVLGKYVEPPQVPSIFQRMNGTVVWMRGLSISTLRRSVTFWRSELDEIGKNIVSCIFPDSCLNAAFDRARLKKNTLKVLVKLDCL